MRKIRYLLTVVLLGGLGYSVFGGPNVDQPPKHPQGLGPWGTVDLMNGMT